MINPLWLEAWRRSPVGLAITGDPAALDKLWPALVHSIDGKTFVSPAMELAQLSATRGTAIISHGEAFSPESAAALGADRVLVRCSDPSQLPGALADACPLIATVTAELPELLSGEVDLGFSPAGSCEPPVAEIIDMLTEAGLSAHSLDVPACQFATQLSEVADRNDVLAAVTRWIIEPRVGEPQATPPPAAETPPEAQDNADEQAIEQPPSNENSKQQEAEEKPAQEPDDETPAVPRVGKRGARARGPRWSGRSGAEEVSRSRGRTRRVLRMRDRSEPLAILPTLAAAAPWQPLRRPEGDTVALTRDDLRTRQRIARGGGLAIIVVDASGSMGLGAIRAAKATALGVLEQGYRNRDRVAIIVARGHEAYVGLPETRSISRARDSIRTLPTGGGTPLASALLKASELASRHEPARVRVVVLTDGNANVGLNAVGKEAARIDALRALTQLRPMVADVQFLPLGTKRRRGDPLAWLTQPNHSTTKVK